MRLITLNIWGGHVNEALLNFIETHSDIDIFCFQEVYHNAEAIISTEDRQHNLNIFSEIQDLLPEHRGFFKPVVKNIYGIGMFVKNTVDILGEGDVTIFDNPNYPGIGPTHSRKLQWLEYCFNNKTYAILNVHGLWNGQGKTDSPARISQSKRIKEFMNTISAPKILCGDLNLMPETDSLKILEEGMCNLIKLHNFTSTRTSLYPKTEKFADYILISPDIIINQFEVLPDEVSDHAPLFLDFI